MSTHMKPLLLLACHSLVPHAASPSDVKTLTITLSVTTLTAVPEMCPRIIPHPAALAGCAFRHRMPRAQIPVVKPGGRRGSDRVRNLPDRPQATHDRGRHRQPTDTALVAAGAAHDAARIAVVACCDVDVDACGATIRDAPCVASSPGEATQSGGSSPPRIPPADSPTRPAEMWQGKAGRMPRRTPAKPRFRAPDRECPRLPSVTHATPSGRIVATLAIALT